MAVVSFAPPDEEGGDNPGEALLSRILFGLESMGHEVSPPGDEEYCWAAEVVVDGASCEVRAGWTGDEWLVTLDPPPVGPFPRLRGLLGADPRARSQEVAQRFAADLHDVLGAIGRVRWYTPDDHRPGHSGAATPFD